MKFNRRDSNEQSIVSALRRVGCLVDRVERKAYDLVVTRGRSVFLLELKFGKGALTAAQLKFLAAGWPISVVRTIDEALKAVGL